MTPTEQHVLIALALIAVVGIFIAVFLRSWLGRAVRGTLHVPQGKDRVSVEVSVGQSAVRFKYGQVFEVAIDEAGVVTHKGKEIGSTDVSNPYVRLLSKLAERYQRVEVSALVVNFDESGKPVIELEMPDAGWFKRAVKAAKSVSVGESDESRDGER
jgi:hypothetical protein